jgi:ABC-type antimicrobial peptide transport system permease subunit
MILLNLLKLSIRNFKNMRLRSTLTVLGIGIGIGAILFLVSLGQGLQRLLIERITTAEALLTLDVAPAADGLVDIDRTALAQIHGIPTVTETSPIKSQQARISSEGLTATVTANFVQENFFRLAGFGSLFRNGDALATSSDAIVSQAVLNLLSIEDEPKGKEVVLKVFEEDEEIINKIFTISGVVDDEFNSFVYVAVSAYPEERLVSFNSLKVQVLSTQVIEETRTEIVGLGFIVSALSDTVKQANQVFRIMQIILGIFGVVALTVAAIGMFNTMTIALLERTNEIGIMRAIGASRKDIWLMFLTEAVVIGFLGGVSGVLIGVALAESSNAGLNLLATRLGGQALDIFFYPVWFVVAIIIFSTMVSLITGFYPAQRAAKLNPLEALRYK